MNQNTKNRHRGAEFEQLIDAGCEYYRNRGIADIWKTPEPMRVLKPLNKGHFEAVFTRKAQPDYKGTLKGGRSVCFEAKFTSTGRMEKTRVTDEQARELELQYRLGAEVFVLCDFDHQTIARVPWSLWRSMKERFGRNYITLGDCILLSVPMRGCVRFLWATEWEDK